MRRGEDLLNLTLIGDCDETKPSALGWVLTLAEDHAVDHGTELAKVAADPILVRVPLQTAEEELGGHRSVWDGRIGWCRRRRLFKGEGGLRGRLVEGGRGCCHLISCGRLRSRLCGRCLRSRRLGGRRFSRGSLCRGCRLGGVEPVRGHRLLGRFLSSCRLRCSSRPHLTPDVWRACPDSLAEQQR